MTRVTALAAWIACWYTLSTLTSQMPLQRIIVVPVLNAGSASSLPMTLQGTALKDKSGFIYPK